MGALTGNPFVVMLALPAAGGLLLAAMARLYSATLPARLVTVLVFLIAYGVTYGKVPAFPPLGSTNKIFYIALFGAALGFALDLATPAARGPQVVLRRAAEIVWPFAVAAWIAKPRLAGADLGLLLAMAGLCAGGALVLWRLDAVGMPERADAGEMVATAMLATLALGFAPIALLGASSTSFGLCLGLAAGLAAAALVSLVSPRQFGATVVLGAGGAFLAVVDTVALITQQLDYLALAVLLAVLFAGQIGARLFLSRARLRPRSRKLLIALMAVSPIPVVLAVLLLRQSSPLGT